MGNVLFALELKIMWHIESIQSFIADMALDLLQRVECRVQVAFFELLEQLRDECRQAFGQFCGVKHMSLILFRFGDLSRISLLPREHILI